MNPNPKKVFGIIVSASFLLAACSRPVKISAPPLGSKLVFSSPDGKTIGDPIWSPAGDELAFTAFDPWIGDNEVYIADLSTGDVRTLIGQNGVEAQAWSPDGTSIAYNRYREIWIIRIDRISSAELLASGQVAAWSPNGKQMAIFENISTTDPGVYILKILDLETGLEEIILTLDVEEQEIFDLSWAPDNTRLAFSLPPEKADRADSNRDIYIYDLEMRELSQFTTDDVNYLPTWSPDGKQIAYLHRSSGTGISSIAISQVDSGCKATVPGITDVSDLAWSPAGSFLAYSLHTDIYLLDLIEVFGSDFRTVGPTCP